MSTYTPEFFFWNAGPSLVSARAVLPIVFRLVPHASVIDVGCGIGAWARAAIEVGSQRCVGVDGDYVPRSQLLIDEFVAADLTQPLPELGRYDLALCLEVGEHLPAGAAATLVESLVRLAPRILFSAAVPAQGGVEHINEQWPSYWDELFQAHGYGCTDCIRSVIWEEERIEPWYRQNLLLFSAEPIPGYESDFARRPDNLVHPAFTQSAMPTDPNQ